jgi:glutamine amidotransferase
MGNLRSVVKAVELYTDSVRISSSPDAIYESEGIILPGDGAFAMAMDNLDRLGLIKPLKEHIAKNGFFLGICLGFQLLFSRQDSEESRSFEGFDITYRGNVVKFKS